MKRKVLTWFLCVFFFGHASGFAFMNIFLDEGYQGLASNSVTDIIFDGRYIWAGTGNGLSKSGDSGQTWISYNQSNGLNQSGVSALAYTDSTLWVATSYNVIRENQLYPFGAGFNTTGTFGETWDTISSEQASGYGRICYDIANMEGEAWAACWYGGLIRSQDSGKTWLNVFPNSASQYDWELGYFERLDNKFFSVVVDTSPMKFYLDKNFITKIDGKVINDTLLLWVGTKNGLHFSFDTLGIWTNIYDSTYPNFHKNSISSVRMGDNSVWAGIFSQENGKMVGEGIQRSKDYGASWSYYTPAQANSDSQMVLDITSIGDSLVWAACWHGGLIRSEDSGSTWESIFVDSLARYNFENGIEDSRNGAYAIAVDTISDTLILWAGTEAGIFKFIYTSSDSFDTVISYNHAGLSISGDSVFSLAIQRYDDKKIIWAGTGPKGSTGAFGISRSEDNGQTWQILPSLSGTEVRDFAFSDSVVWIATNVGLKRSLDWGNNWESIEVVDTLGKYSYFRPSTYKLRSYDLNSVFIANGTIWVGGKEGLACSTDPIAWSIFNFSISYDRAVWAGSAAGIFKFIYSNSDSADTALQYTTSDSLTGNFVVALAIQKYADKKIIWAATNPTYAGTGTYGISKSEDEGETWVKCLQGRRVWNFAFCDSIVWAATDSGLQRSSDHGGHWDVFNYMQDLNDTLTDNRIFSTVFYSVCALKDTSSGRWTVWGGNLDGLVKSVDVEDGRWNVYRSFVPIGTPGSETAYAYPSPFSPALLSGARVRIHHRPLEDSYITVKMYDFAMNLVTTVVENQFRFGGKDYDEPWDGRNDKGDLVVNGVYFFKVETSKGQKEWGKLVILK